MTHPSDQDLPPDDALDGELRALIARAESLPPLRPARDLWPDISARLDAADSAHPTPTASQPAGVRVLAFPTPRAGHPGVARRAWLAAAAAIALTTVSSGATYIAMRRPTSTDIATLPVTAIRGTPSASPRAAPPRQPPDAPALAATRNPGSPDHPSLDSALADAPDRSPRVAWSRATARAATRSDREGPGGTTVSSLLAVSRSADAAVPGAAEYDREIADLRAVVAGRHGDLDSATVAVLARNLAIIDTAIAASRAALAHDPHSPFLGEQLTRTLGQKVELLRTAALLPRT